MATQEIKRRTQQGDKKATMNSLKNAAYEN